MDLRGQIAKYPGEPEDRLMLSHALDVLERGRLKNRLFATDFLTPREQALIRQQLGILEPVFFGGAEETERKVCLYLPSHVDKQEFAEEGPVIALRAHFSAREKLSHRDFLGALMGSGIRRESVGDLFVGEESCDLFVTRAIAPYVLQNLLSAGRAHLSLEEISLSQVVIPERKTQLRRDTVASLRLDGVCSAAFRLSREKAAQAIAAGKVAVNSLPCEKPDRLVKEGDELSLRGSGKAVLEEVSGSTKKGRIAIVIRFYL